MEGELRIADAVGVLHGGSRSEHLARKREVFQLHAGEIQRHLLSVDSAVVGISYEFGLSRARERVVPCGGVEVGGESQFRSARKGSRCLNRRSPFQRPGKLRKIKLREDLESGRSTGRRRECDAFPRHRAFVVGDGKLVEASVGLRVEHVVIILLFVARREETECHRAGACNNKMFHVK